MGLNGNAIFGSPATIAPGAGFRSVTLRPTLSDSLPLSDVFRVVL